MINVNLEDRKLNRGKLKKEEIERIKYLREMGYSINKIGLIVNRSAKSVQRVLKKYSSEAQNEINQNEKSKTEKEQLEKELIEKIKENDKLKEENEKLRKQIDAIMNSLLDLSNKITQIFK
jgi:IS30 family transposase